MRNNHYLTRSKITLVILAMMLAARGSIGLAQDIQPIEGVVEQQRPLLAQNLLIADPPLMGEGVISIGPEAFQPWNRETTVDRGSGLWIRPLTPVETVSFDAPLMIPNGASIRQIVAYIFDNDGTRNAELNLLQHSHTSSSGVLLSNAYSTGASTSMQAVSISSSFGITQVNLANYSYIIRVRLFGGANMYLNSVRIDYSYHTYLPAIQK